MESLRVFELYRMEYEYPSGERYVTEVGWEPELRAYLFRTGQRINAGQANEDLVDTQMAIIPEDSIVPVIEAILKHHRPHGAPTDDDDTSPQETHD